MSPADAKARHDKMVELVTRMMELKKQQACPRGSRRARAPKKQSPCARQLLFPGISGATLEDFGCPTHLTRPARNDKMVGLVETMQMTADGLRLTASG